MMRVSIAPEVVHREAFVVAGAGPCERPAAQYAECHGEAFVPDGPGSAVGIFLPAKARPA
jgi:hypothetical protein